MISDVFEDLMSGDRAVTVRSRRGRAVLQVGLVPALAAGAVALIAAPRATAVAAVGAMFRGISLTVDRVEPPAETAEAA